MIGALLIISTLVTYEGESLDELTPWTTNTYISASESHFFKTTLEVEEVSFGDVTNVLNSITNSPLFIKTDPSGEDWERGITGFSCQSVWDTKGYRNGTHIGDDLVLFVNHYPNTGGAIYFTDDENNTAYSYIAEHGATPEVDLQIGRLNNKSVGNIVPAKLLTAKELALVPDNTPLICLHDNKLSVYEPVQINKDGIIQGSNILYPDLAPSLGIGDSGAPLFLVLGDDLFLIGKVVSLGGQAVTVTKERVDRLVENMDTGE